MDGTLRGPVYAVQLFFVFCSDPMERNALLLIALRSFHTNTQGS